METRSPSGAEKHSWSMTPSESTKLPIPTAAMPHELYSAPPRMMSRPFSMQPWVVAESSGCGTWSATSISYMLVIDTHQSQK